MVVRAMRDEAEKEMKTSEEIPITSSKLVKRRKMEKMLKVVNT